MPKSSSSTQPPSDVYRLQFERRHLVQSTTIALERFYWDFVDALAAAEGIPWAEWVNRKLATKPATIGPARWLRVIILEAAQQAPRGLEISEGEPAGGASAYSGADRRQRGDGLSGE